MRKAVSLSSCHIAEALCISVVVLAFRHVVQADPLPGEVLKFQQLPLDGGVAIPTPYVGPFIAPNPFALPPGGPGYPTPTAPFPGHDELSTANANQFNGQTPVGWQGTFMADDFADRFNSPVVHVRWWGSYLNNVRLNGVNRFLISFESDVPAGPSNSFSHPGTPILNQIVTLGAIAAGSGTYTEVPVPGAAPNPTDGPLYQYNAELNAPLLFPQTPNTVYWLKIVALVNPTLDGNIQWGWHDRDWMVPDLEASVPPAVVPGEGIIGAVPTFGSVWHFQDDAVTGAVTISPGVSSIQPSVLQDQLTFAPQNYVEPVDGPTGISQFSKDLAFELYTVPEPGCASLLSVAGLLSLKRRPRGAYHPS